MRVDDVPLVEVKPYERIKLKIGVIIGGEVRFFKMCPVLEYPQTTAFKVLDDSYSYIDRLIDNEVPSVS